MIATITMIYLTITGSKLLRLDISNEKAQKELRRHAESRSLARKLERHKAIWTGEKFELAENSIEDHTPHKTLL